MSHTPTPWISKGVVITGGTVARNERVAEVCYHAKIPWEANASVIVERVNGWDALVAERDSLRDHVRILREALDASLRDILATYLIDEVLREEKGKPSEPEPKVLSTIRAALDLTEGKG